MIGPFTDFVECIREFVTTLLPDELSSPIMLVVGIVIALAAWRIVS